MTDSLDGLESYVEAIDEELLVAGCFPAVNRNRLAKAIVLALAEPLRRAERVEPQEESLKPDRETIRQRRIEELEAALRDARSYVDQAFARCDRAMLDTEAKP